MFRGSECESSEIGQRTFILIARYPGSSNPTRRALGEYPALSLTKARERAREWRELIRKGVDPKAEEERAEADQELRKQADHLRSRRGGLHSSGTSRGSARRGTPKGRSGRS